MSYSEARVLETSWLLSNRLRGVIVQDDLYPLVYLADAARRSGVAADARKAVEIAADGDDDIAARLEQALGRVASNTTFESLVETVSGFEADAVSAYLMHGPVSQGVFGGECATPEGVARLTLAILDIQPGDRVIDYGSGQGNFLEMVAGECPQALLSGVEVNADTLTMAKIRSKACGSRIAYACDDMFRFYENNVAHCPVDKAFSNYPWGMQARLFARSSDYIKKVLKGQERYNRPASADWVFNRLLVDSLSVDGTAVAIMSNGACFNGMDKPVREYFVKNGFIKAVIALPKGVFAPYTMIQTSLVILCAGGAKGVRFVDATDLGVCDRRGCTIDGDAIEAILARLNNDSDKSAFKWLDEIAAREFDLSARRYLEKQIEIANGVELGNIAQITRGASIRAAELDALVCEEDTGISYLNLGNISDGGIDDDLPNLSELDPKLEKYCIHDGDVLISKNGAPFKVVVAEVPEGRKILANGNMYVLTVDRDKINPYYLAAFFASPTGKELLAREAVGTSIPNVPVRALSAIKVPLEDAAKQKAVADAYLAKTDEIKVLKLRLSRARQEIVDLFDEEG